MGNPVKGGIVNGEWVGAGLVAQVQALLADWIWNIQEM
ncbi:hypothetical protein DLM_0905 [Aquitalea magnusonii]|uniref:Uncharacterized protein n=1 Tax=Aquitalea magnusonii TaxID=332411 RepID=A0A3G9GAN4_9NEIS|nr:hypothetical protein DLM_0905 [Aquitalea magnusonii]